MAIFNSYVKLPEGKTTNNNKSGVSTLRRTAPQGDGVLSAQLPGVGLVDADEDDPHEGHQRSAASGTWGPGEKPSDDMVSNGGYNGLIMVING